MVPISDVLQSALNAQIAHEIGNSFIYSHVASWASLQGLKRIAAYFATQADGEKEHAGWIIDILKDANAPLAIAEIPQKPSQFPSCYEVALLYVETEAATTARLEAIAKISDAEYNIGVQDLMQKMLREQIEEEGSADRFSQLVRICGGNVIFVDLMM